MCCDMSLYQQQWQSVAPWVRRVTVDVNAAIYVLVRVCVCGWVGGICEEKFETILFVSAYLNP